MNTARIIMISTAITLSVAGTGCSVDEAGPDSAAFDDESGGEPTDGEEGDGLDDPRTYGGWLGSSLGTAIASGTTAGQTNEFTPTCAGGSTAPDVSFTWTAPHNAWYTFSTAGSKFNTVLHVRSFTDSTQTLGCNNNFGGTLQSSVTLQLTAGTTVVVVVDGAGSKAGNYQLNIGESLCETACNTPPNECHQQGVCIPSFGGWHECYYPVWPIGFMTCNDGIACTGGDVCINGGCVGEWTTCAPGQMCTADLGCIP